MRQSTNWKLNAGAFLISKLPMRQSTARAYALIWNEFSKLPMRQST